MEAFYDVTKPMGTHFVSMILMSHDLSQPITIGLGQMHKNREKYARLYEGPHCIEVRTLKIKVLLKTDLK